MWDDTTSADEGKASAAQPETKSFLKNKPGELAICRNIAGGDLTAGVFLYRLVALWKYREKKLVRFKKEWLAMPRADWARSAGLTESELKNRALPKLRKHCPRLIEARQMKLRADDKAMPLWIRLDVTEFDAAIMPWDMYEPKMNGAGIFQKAAAYPYKSD